MHASTRRDRCATAKGWALRWGKWLAPLSLLGLLGCAPLRGHESMLVLLDAAAGAAPSRLKQVSAPPTRTPVAYTVDGRPHTADLYLPGSGAPAAAIVLVPGAVPHGKDDAQLVAFAQTLARARFAVLAPELAGLRQLRLHPGDARPVADAVVHLASRADLAPAGRVGIAAFSYAVGPALLAALEPDLRHQVRFILGVGGYHDLAQTVGYFTTGRFAHDGRWYELEPNPYGTLVLANSSLPYLSAPDRVILERMVALRLQDRTAAIAPLAPGLGPHGAAVYALLTNTEPGRVAQLLAALPAQLGADLAALSLHDKELAGLQARLILLHGKNDNLIPYPQSIALAAAVPAGSARLFLINRLLGHVDLSLGHLLSWQFLSRELPDAWRLWRAVDALLAEREPAGRP